MFEIYDISTPSYPVVTAPALNKTKKFNKRIIFKSKTEENGKICMRNLLNVLYAKNIYI